MKTAIQTLLVQTGLRHVWNRAIAGNRIRIDGAGNQIDMGHSLLTHTSIRIQGRDNHLSIGNGCRFHDLKIFLLGDGLRIEIGDNCHLRGKLKAEDRGSQIAIGAGTTMENSYLGAYEGARIAIGGNCMFSDQVGVRTGDMHSIVDAATGERLNPSRDVSIAPHVWLCRGVTVLKGCSIGTHSVVGGYSIVAASLPPHVLAAGIPAKILREGIDWRRERV